MAMAFVHSFGAAIAVRFLLGVAEGAVFPGIAFYLSRFYRKDELGFRLSCYIVCAPAAGAVGGLLASGILKIHSIGWLRQWRYVLVLWRFKESHAWHSCALWAQEDCDARTS